VRRQAVVVQAAVAAGALTLAAWTWLSPPTPVVAGAVPATDFKPGQVTAVRYDDGSHAVDVVRNTPGAPGVRVRVARSPSLSAPDAGTPPDGGMPVHPDGGVVHPDAGAPLRLDGGVVRGRDGGVESVRQALNEAPPPPDREYRGNELAEQLLDRVAPLMATRDLGKLAPDRVQQMGLGATTKTLRIEAGTGRSAQFRVSTPPGAAGTYLLGPDGRVWVVADALTQDLSAALSRLVDRRLHTFKPDDPDTLTLVSEGRARSWVVRRIQGVNKLAPVDSPDSPSAEATLWADRVWRLQPVELLGKGEVPREGTPQPQFRLEYLRNRRPLGHLEVARAGNETYVRTENTVGWVRLPAGSGTLAEQAEHLETTP
jgi:hypothetical protein